VTEGSAAARAARSAAARAVSEATGWRTARRVVLVVAVLLGGLVMVPLFAVGSSPAAPATAASAGLPGPFLEAFVMATAGDDDAACGLRWSVLAAVGQVESGNGAGRSVSPDGSVTPPVVGPPLDGSPGVQAVHDTDGGAWDGDAVWDHAVGPLQLIPSTWRVVARDGNGDGLADPHNVYDAAAAAAALLCSSGDVSTPDGLHRALLAYNHSDAYAAVVEAWVARFDFTADEGRPLVAGAHALPIDRAWFDREPSWLSLPHHDYPAADLPVPVGTPVYAAAPGRVVGVSQADSRCGLGLVVAGADGWDYVYCHASQVLAVPGEEVAAGQLVGRSGSTGHSTGPHLHFGMQTPSGERVCPQPFLRAWYGGGQPPQPTSEGCTT